MQDIFKPPTNSELLQRRIQFAKETVPREFVDVIRVTHRIPITSADIKVMSFSPSHHSISGKFPHVSVFLWSDEGICMKIARARTKNELCRQYNYKSHGSLAEELRRRFPSLWLRYIGPWIKNHTYRFDFTLDKKFGKNKLYMLEFFFRTKIGLQI